MYCIYYLVQDFHFPFMILVTHLENDGTQDAVMLHATYANIYCCCCCCFPII